MPSRPQVFTIPASQAFLPTLIDALIKGRLVAGFPAGADPLALATATIYLPTRRACRLAHQVFLDALRCDAAILPRIVPIGDVDEDELAFAEAATGDTGAALELPEALDGLERLIPLARIILKWAAAMPRQGGGPQLIAATPTAAFQLAQDLARLMDDLATRHVDWKRLDSLVPDGLDRYWSVTLDFLKFIREHWPAVLAEQGRIEAAARRDALIAAEAERLARSGGPVIAAGSTGSIPATATLLATIARLPHGAVVLPGLDTLLDDATWRIIESDGTSDHAELAHGHPQFAMAALLRRIGMARGDVIALAQPAPHGRERSASEAMRPAAASELWKDRLAEPGFAGHADAALSSVAVIEAANAEEEALAIAVALREVMEHPSKTAALVTPDRALARRVLAALARWNVPVDDSGGDALSETPAGVFARLVAEVALDGVAPVPLLALLKHPLCRADERAVAALERAVLRGPRPKRGSAGLAAALKTFREEHAKFYTKDTPSSLHPSDPRVTIRSADLDAAADLVERLRTALAPLETLPRGPLTFAKLAQLHRDAVTALAQAPSEELVEEFDKIVEAGGIEIAPADYPDLFLAAIAERKVRRPEAQVRVRIFGTIESRLQSVDRMVLGGLVEGVWPPEMRSDPWLSRPMRHELGLDLPERRIGLSAHDFVQALGAPEVILTRAAKLGGAPTVASRFLLRLAAVAGKERWSAAQKRGASYIALARALDTPAGRPQPVQRPRPKPPLAARPMSLSVTEIEHWLRDPYTIYAKHVLKLAPLDAVDTPPGAADRGTVIHGAIGDFTRLYTAALPDDAMARLEALGRERFAPLADYEEARAFWWPRFLRIAAWFVGTFEPERRAALSAMDAEIRGIIEIPAGDTVFKLRGVADRIERLAGGGYAILDYKTGQPPTEKQVRTGLSPQLTLEAAMLRRGGFPGIPAGGSVRELAYVALRGGDPPGRVEAIEFKEGTPDSQAERAFQRLAEVATRFADEATPYISLVHPMWARRYGDYDHLARVKEWSFTGGAIDPGDGG